MGNTRGMMAGLGQALSTVGTIGLNDQFERDKEARLEKIRLDAEARAETRGLAAEGRQRQYAGEDRAMRNEDAIAAEGRAAEQAGKDRAAEQANRLEVLQKTHNLTKAEMAEKVRLEKEAAASTPNYQTKTIEMPDGTKKVYAVDSRGLGDPYRIDPETETLIPMSVADGPVAARLPTEYADEAKRIAISQVDEMDSFLASNEDKDRLRALGGREAAIVALTNTNIPSVVRAAGRNPADFGYTEGQGLLTKAAQPPVPPPQSGKPIGVAGATAGNKAPSAAPVTSSPIPGVSAGVYEEAVRRLRANGKPTDPATVQKYLDHFKGNQNGGSQR